MQQILESQDKISAETYFSMKKVAEITELSVDLIRVYQKEFNLQVERTSNGHRRFNQKNISDLLAIKEKIQNEGWTYKQVRDWLGGNVIVFQSSEVKSNLEKQFEDLAEKVTDQSDLLKALIVKLDEQTKAMEQQQRYIEDSLKVRDRQLTEHMRAQFDVAVSNEATRKNRGFFQRFFRAK